MTTKRPDTTLPDEALETVTRFRLAELTTFGKDNTPITVAIAPMWQRENRTMIATTTIGIPQKAYNIRRNPKVALLYSDPTGSGLHNPSTVLIQGDATVSELTVWDDEIAEWWRHLWRIQPDNNIGEDKITRRYLDWYYLRLKIIVTPCRVLWWRGGDMTCPPKELTL